MYRRKKFNPPLKIRQDNANSTTDVLVGDETLPASQTHTLLSLCDQQSIQPAGNTRPADTPQSTENSPQIENIIALQSSNRFPIHRQKENYKYCMYPISRKPRRLSRGKTLTVGRPKLSHQQMSVYDYTLTPSTTHNKPKKTPRTQQQARLLQ